MRRGWSMLLLLAVAGRAGAQRVQLELRPKAGDTLHMRLDQAVEVNGAREGRAPLVVGSELTMFSRAIVEDEAITGATILALTDSVNVHSSDAHGRALVEDARRQLVGRQMRLLLRPDGTVEAAAGAERLPREVSDLVAIMPASFPRDPVAVGDTWSRQMPIPPSTQFGIPLGGIVRARFRLDSLSSGGATAFVSMRGTLEPPPAEAGAASGTIGGAMTVDRRRGWLTESRFLVQIRTTVVAPGSPDGTPTHFRVRVTQHMHVAPARLP